MARRRVKRGGPRPSLPRRDRALHHAELSDLGSVEYVAPLTSLLDGNTLKRLELTLAAAKAEIKSLTSVSAAVFVLGYLSTFNRMRKGYRGVICPLEELARGVRRWFGARCGPSTCRNALAILERARYVTRALSGRGAPYEYEDLETGDKAQARCLVLCVTLTPKAIRLWASPRRRRPSTDQGGPLKFGGKPLSEDQALPDTANTRAIRSSKAGLRDRDGAPGGPGTPRGGRDAVSSRAAALEDVLNTAQGPPRGGPAAEATNTRPRLRPRRRWSYPARGSPRTWWTCRQALLAAIETEARKRGLAELDLLLDVVERETDRDYCGDMAVPWDRYVWAWRDLDQVERRRMLSGTIFPALALAARREWILRGAPADREIFVPWVQRGGARHSEPGPRARDPALVEFRGPGPPPAPAMSDSEALMSRMRSDPEWERMLRKFDRHGVPLELGAGGDDVDED